MERINEVARFYYLLVRLERRCGGRRRLGECHGRMGWPWRGVYFFFEPGEHRSDSGAGDRVVRVGTHALAERSGASLWQRLSQHRGSARHGGGNHRGSIFRLLAGSAIKAHDGTEKPRSWGIESGAAKAALRLGTDRETVRQEATGAMSSATPSLCSATSARSPWTPLPSRGSVTTPTENAFADPACGTATMSRTPMTPVFWKGSPC